MARPRVIRTKDGGEILLKNVDPQLSSLISDLVNGKGSLGEPITSSAPMGVMTSKALGINKDKDGVRWCLTEVHYNPFTKEAKVEKVTTCGNEKLEATEKYKIESVVLGMVD